MEDKEDGKCRVTFAVEIDVPTGRVLTEGGSGPGGFGLPWIQCKCKSPCPKDQMVIDMVACVPAKRFFGSPLSTFSAGILQWRNRLRPDVVQQFTMPVNPPVLEPISHTNILWAIVSDYDK